MKKVYLFLLLSIIFIRLQGQGVTRNTPTGVSVHAEEFTETYSDEEIAAANVWWQDSIIRADWNAEIVAPSSSIYNCHGFAWHISDGGDTVRIPHDYDVSKYYTENGGKVATYKRVDNPAKFKKVYYNGASHSAIVDPYNSSRLISKWGPGPLVNHLPGDSPYDNYTLEYYELIMDDLPASVAKGCAFTIQIITSLSYAHRTHAAGAIIPLPVLRSMIPKVCRSSPIRPPEKLPLLSKRQVKKSCLFQAGTWKFMLPT
jgi:hypothetical protein